MLTKLFSAVAFACMAVSYTSASPIKARAPASHQDLSGFNGAWYAEATSPAIYEALESWYTASGYSCECMQTHFQPAADYLVDVTMSCDLHKDNEIWGQATAVGQLELYNYKDGLYSFWYKSGEVYYVADAEPDKKYSASGMYDYYSDDIHYYPIAATEGGSYEGFLEFTTYEHATYSSLYTKEYVDDSTLDQAIMALGDYGLDLVKVDTSYCH